MSKNKNLFRLEFLLFLGPCPTSGDVFKQLATVVSLLSIPDVNKSKPCPKVLYINTCTVRLICTPVTAAILRKWAANFASKYITLSNMENRFSLAIFFLAFTALYTL